jgi:hypothetical protein
MGAVAYFIPGKRHRESCTATRGKNTKPLKSGLKIAVKQQPVKGTGKTDRYTYSC